MLSFKISVAQKNKLSLFLKPMSGTRNCMPLRTEHKFEELIEQQVRIEESNHWSVTGQKRRIQYLTIYLEDNRMFAQSWTLSKLSFYLFFLTLVHSYQSPSRGTEIISNRLKRSNSSRGYAMIFGQCRCAQRTKVIS